MSAAVSLKRNVLANYIGQGIAGLMSFAFVPVYIAKLGPEGYGLIGFFALLQACLLAIDISIAMTLGREMARFTAGVHTQTSIRNFVRSAEILIMGFAMLLTGLVALSADWLEGHWIQAHALEASSVKEAIVLMGIILGMRLIEGLYRGCLLGLQRQVVANILGSTVAILRWGGAAWVLVWVEDSVFSFFSWQCFAAALASLLYFGAVKHCSATTDVSLRFTVKPLREVTPFFTTMLLTYGLGFILTQADKLILSKTLTLENFGHYTLAALAASVLSMLASPVSQALYPRLTVHASQNDAMRLSAAYHLGAQLLTVLITPAAMILIVFGKDLLAVWTGDATLATRVGPLLQVLAFGTLLNGYMGMPHMLQLAHGWAGLSARINVVAAFFFLPAIAWVAPNFGAQGTAWLWVLLNAGYIVIGIPIMHRRLLRDEMWRWWWKDITAPGLVAVIVVVVSFILYSGTAPALVTWLWLTATALLGVACAALAADHLRARIFDIFWRPRAG